MKSKVYPFNKRGINGREQLILDGISSVHQCSVLYEGDAVDDCIRDILINFSADGWSTGFQAGQQP